MPDDNKPRRLKRPERPPPSSEDEDSSVDSKGNIRDLIDYDYEESSEEPAKRPRASAIAAKRKIRKIMKLTPDSEQSAPHIKVMDVDQESTDDDIVKPKRRVTVESNRNVLIPEHKSKAKEMEMDTDSSSEEEVKRSKKEKKQKRDKKEKKKDKKKKRREESSEEEEDEEEYDYECDYRPTSPVSPIPSSTSRRHLFFDDDGYTYEKNYVNGY